MAVHDVVVSRTGELISGLDGTRLLIADEDDITGLLLFIANPILPGGGLGADRVGYAMLTEGTLGGETG